MMTGVRCYLEGPRICYLGLLLGSMHTAIVGGPLSMLLSGPAFVLNRHLAPPGRRAGPNRMRRNRVIQPNTRSRVGPLRPTSWAPESEKPAIPALTPGRARDGTGSEIRNVNVWFASTTSTPRNSRTLLFAHTTGIRSAGGWKFVGGFLELRPPPAAFAANRCTGGALIGPR